jgi:hypothetical protein
MSFFVQRAGEDIRKCGRVSKHRCLLGILRVTAKGTKLEPTPYKVDLHPSLPYSEFGSEQEFDGRAILSCLLENDEFGSHGGSRVELLAIDNEGRGGAGWEGISLKADGRLKSEIADNEFT